jgi:hypothetical protein
MPQQAGTSLITSAGCNAAKLLSTRIPPMNRSSIALFLSTLALAGGTVACGKVPEAGEEGGSDAKELRSPDKGENGESSGNTERPDNHEDREGGEGGEGGEG